MTPETREFWFSLDSDACLEFGTKQSNPCGFALRFCRSPTNFRVPTLKKKKTRKKKKKLNLSTGIPFRLMPWQRYILTAFCMSCNLPFTIHAFPNWNGILYYTCLLWESVLWIHLIMKHMVRFPVSRAYTAFIPANCQAVHTHRRRLFSPAIVKLKRCSGEFVSINLCRWECYCLLPHSIAGKSLNI